MANNLGQGIDLNALLQSAQTTTPTIVAPTPAAVPAQLTTTKVKKPGKTAFEKRTQMIVDVLSGKDTFNIHFCNLLLQLSPVELSKHVAWVQSQMVK